MIKTILVSLFDIQEFKLRFTVLSKIPIPSSLSLFDAVHVRHAQTRTVRERDFSGLISVIPANKFWAAASFLSCCWCWYQLWHLVCPPSLSPDSPARSVLTHLWGNNSLTHSNDSHTLTCPLKILRFWIIIRIFFSEFSTRMGKITISVFKQFQYVNSFLRKVLQRMAGIWNE